MYLMCSFQHRFSSLNILIVLCHYYLYLILEKGADYRPFRSVCEKISTLFCLHLVTFENKPLIDSF